LKPETAIAGWRQWQGNLSHKPGVVRQLEDGRSNRTYLLESGEKRMVLRLHGNESLLPWGSRSTEIRIWQAASYKGIAPPLLYIDEQHGFLVSEFIRQSPPSQGDFDEMLLKQVLSLVEQCHKLELDVPALDYAQHIDHYWELINKSNTAISKSLLLQREPMQALHESLLQTNPRTGLCHHDLVKANFVGGRERLYLIDWEYAATGPLIMDYAALAIEWQIDDETLLQKSGNDPQQLDMAKTLYRYLCTLWEQASLSKAGQTNL
jgi:thiamine kinase-like enzyme